MVIPTKKLFDKILATIGNFAEEMAEDIKISVNRKGSSSVDLTDCILWFMYVITACCVTVLCAHQLRMCPLVIWLINHHNEPPQ